MISPSEQSRRTEASLQPVGSEIQSGRREKCEIPNPRTPEPLNLKTSEACSLTARHYQVSMSSATVCIVQTILTITIPVLLTLLVLLLPPSVPRRRRLLLALLLLRLFAPWRRLPATHSRSSSRPTSSSPKTRGRSLFEGRDAVSDSGFGVWF